MRGAAAIITLEDTVEVRYRDDLHVFRTEELYPSPYVQMVYWVEKDSYSEELTDEQHQKQKLRLRKLTNHSSSYALHGYGCLVNDETCDYYYMYRDPADSVRTYYDWSSKSQSTMSIPLYPQLCSLQQLVDALIAQYPDRITILDDTENHYIGAEDDGRVDRDQDGIIDEGYARLIID